MRNKSFRCSLGFHAWGRWQGVETVYTPNWLDKSKGTFIGQSISWQRNRFCEHCLSRQAGKMAKPSPVLPVDADSISWKPFKTTTSVLKRIKTSS